jgi:hypothetical protein
MKYPDHRGYQDYRGFSSCSTSYLPGSSGLPRKSVFCALPISRVTGLSGLPGENETFGSRDMFGVSERTVGDICTIRNIWTTVAIRIIGNFYVPETSKLSMLSELLGKTELN